MAGGMLHERGELVALIAVQPQPGDPTAILAANSAASQSGKPATTGQAITVAGRSGSPSWSTTAMRTWALSRFPQRPWLDQRRR